MIWSMSQNNDIRHGRHCVSSLHAHFVFMTKYRRGMFTKEVIDDHRGIFALPGLRSGASGVDGNDDHVHLLVNYPPKVAVSVLVNSLKGVSSRVIRQKNFPSIRRKLWGGALWSPSPFAGSSSGAPLSVVPVHKQQRTPH
jgi:putative transposase